MVVPQSAYLAQDTGDVEVKVRLVQALELQPEEMLWWRWSGCSIQTEEQATHSELPGGNGEGGRGHEARYNGLGDKVDDDAEMEQPEGDLNQAHEEGQEHGVGHVGLPVQALDVVRHDQREDGGRPDGELRACPQHSIHEQPDVRRIEPVLCLVE